MMASAEAFSSAAAFLVSALLSVTGAAGAGAAAAAAGTGAALAGVEVPEPLPLGLGVTGGVALFAAAAGLAAPPIDSDTVLP